jgi:hypothetical protein
MFPVNNIKVNTTSFAFAYVKPAEGGLVIEGMTVDGTHAIEVVSFQSEMEIYTSGNTSTQITNYAKARPAVPQRDVAPCSEEEYVAWVEAKAAGRRGRKPFAVVAYEQKNGIVA